MMRCINFDGQFERYATEWMRQNAAQFHNNVDAMEAKMPDVYLQWLNEPADWLDGATPGAYFLRFDDAAALTEMMCEYHRRGVPVPDQLLERLTSLGAEAEEALLALLAREDAPQESVLTAVSLLGEMESSAPMARYVDWIVRRAEHDDRAEMAAEALTAMGAAVVAPVLAHVEEATPSGKETFLDILCNFPGDERILALGLALALTAGLLAGCTAGLGEQPTVTDEPIAATDEVGPGGTLVRPVTIRLVNPGALDNTSSGSATINGSASAASSTFAYAESKQVVAKTSGELKSLTVQEGDRVFLDQVIGGFDETDMDTQIQNAAIQVKTAELTLQNARDKLEDYSITSTIDGEVIEKNYDVGDNIDATTGSTSGVTYPAVIYDLSALTFDINIHELDINKIQVGQQVEITSDALDGQSFTGTVDKVNINGTTSNGVTTYPVTVRIDGSPQELKPGMNISARIIVEDAGQVLCIPVEAVSRGQNGVSLVKVAGPGALDEAGSLADPSKLEDREVTLGRNDESFIEVLSGLEEGETVFIQNAASANPWG